jgi:hypothetical protein
VRFVLLLAWLTLWPTERCLPQTSQVRAMTRGELPWRGRGRNA